MSNGLAETITRISRSVNTEYQANKWVRKAETITAEGTVFSSAEKIKSDIQSFGGPSLADIGVAEDSGFDLVNLTVNAERTWFDYTAEYSKETYPNQQQAEVRIGDIKIYQATITDNPPKPRKVTIYTPGIDGAIIQKFGMSTGSLSCAGQASGNFELTIGDTVSISYGSAYKEGVVDNLSSSYDPLRDMSNVNISVVYQPENT